MEAQRQHNPGLQRADGDAQETPQRWGVDRTRPPSGNG